MRFLEISQETLDGIAGEMAHPIAKLEEQLQRIYEQKA
jgi:hypothetical protein